MIDNNTNHNNKLSDSSKCLKIINHIIHTMSSIRFAQEWTKGLLNWKTIGTLESFRVADAIPIACIWVSYPDAMPNTIKKVIKQVCGEKIAETVYISSIEDNDDAYLVNFWTKLDAWKFFCEKAVSSSKIPRGWKVEVVVPSNYKSQTGLSADQIALSNAITKYGNPDSVIILENIHNIEDVDIRGILVACGLPEARDCKFGYYTVPVIEVRTEEGIFTGKVVIGLGETDRAKMIVEKYNKIGRGIARLVGDGDVR